MGGSCGSIARAVAADAIDLWFKFCHRRIFKEQLYTIKCIEK